MPDLFPILRVLADDPNIKNRFMLLGSASPELMRQVSESLAGRIAFVDVGGFHQRELTHDCRKDLWWRGGFPRAFLASSDSVARRWHLDFFLNFLRGVYSSAWFVVSFGSEFGRVVPGRCAQHARKP